MTKLYELLALKKCAGDVGIEIECEGQNLKYVESGGWCTEDDNSLRGVYPEQRCEWVLVKPIPIRDVFPSIQYLADLQAESEINFSFRTSTHIHVNVQQLEFDEVINMVYTYLLCETVLMNYCGDSRIGNRFCLRMEDAEGFSNYFQKIIKNGAHSLRMLNPNDQIRYAAINLEAMWKYGSLEFRGMEGTLDSTRIHNWASALVNIRTFAKKHKDIRQIHDLFVRNKPEAFFDMVFGEVADVFKYVGFENDMRKGFSLTIDMPYAYRVEEPKKEAAPFKEKLEDMFEEMRGRGVHIEEVPNPFAAAIPPPVKPRARKPKPIDFAVYDLAIDDEIRGEF